MVRKLSSEHEEAAKIKIVDFIREIGQTTAGKNEFIFRNATDALLKAAMHPDRVVRLRAIRSLGQLAASNDAICSKLASLVRDPDPEVRNEVIQAIASAHHYPSMLEALHYSEEERKHDLAIRIADCFYQDIRKQRNLDRWMKGEDSDRGARPPENQTREDWMFERYTLQETLKVYSSHFSTQIRRIRNLHLIRDVIVHLLNLWADHPWADSVEALAFDFMDGKPDAIAAFQELANGGSPDKILGRYGTISEVKAPHCATCRKELEMLRFAIRESETSRAPTTVFSGIVCKECKKIQCSDCKGHPNLSPCKWCGGEVAPAYSKYL